MISLAKGCWSGSPDKEADFAAAVLPAPESFRTGGLSFPLQLDGCEIP
jgi:hypothetical protein